MNKTSVARWSELADRIPAHALVANVDLVVIRYDDAVSVLYGRCHHRGALLADGHVDGENLICGVHGWDYRYRSGVSEYENDERLDRFSSWIEDDQVFVDADEIAAWERDHPQPYRRDEYQGSYQDPHGTPDEPHVGSIRELAAHGLSRTGHHGPSSAMGVTHDRLPKWDDVQFLTAQLHRPPRLDDEPVETSLTIGPRAKKPLELDIPLFVSDMSFGALSEEAKVALAKGADQAGTGICSGEGGMLPDEQEANARYFYELASGRFGFSWDKVARVQAFHFKGGQGAKTGTGGHLPGEKVKGRIAEVRGLRKAKPRSHPRASRLGFDRTDQGIRRRGQGTHGRHPGRLQVERAARREGRRCRARSRLRLHHPRRSRRRDRRGALDLPRQHLGCRRWSHSRALAGTWTPPRPT